MPSIAKRFALSALILALEATFTLLFWAIYSKDRSKPKSYNLPNLCPWKTTALEYDGCCSHSSLSEAVSGQKDNLSPEQIEAKETAQRLKTNASKRAKRSAPARHAEVRAKAVSQYRKTKNSGKHSCELCGFKFPTPGLLKSHLASKRHQIKAGAITVVNRGSKNRALRKYVCTICDVPFGSRIELEKQHYHSKRHLDMVAFKDQASKSSS